MSQMTNQQCHSTEGQLIVNQVKDQSNQTHLTEDTEML